MKKMVRGFLVLLLVFCCADISGTEADYTTITSMASDMPMNDVEQPNILLSMRRGRGGGRGASRGGGARNVRKQRGASRGRSVRTAQRQRARGRSVRPPRTKGRSVSSKSRRASKGRSVRRHSKHRAPRSKARYRRGHRRGYRRHRRGWGYRRYRGPRYFFSGIGFYYHPGWGYWHHPADFCRYYPRAGYWHYYDLGYWYYPRLHFGVYLASKEERIVYVDNDSRDDLHYAVYLRHEVGDDCYLYRVSTPIRIDPSRSAKVYLPKYEDREYIVLADKNESKLRRRVVQSKSGKVIEDDSTNIPDLQNVDQEDIRVEDLSKGERRKLSKMKRNMAKKNKKMKGAVQKIEEIDNPEDTVKGMTAEPEEEEEDIGEDIEEDIEDTEEDSK